MKIRGSVPRRQPLMARAALKKVREKRLDAKERATMMGLFAGLPKEALVAFEQVTGQSVDQVVESVFRQMSINREEQQREEVERETPLITDGSV